MRKIFFLAVVFLVALCIPVSAQNSEKPQNQPDTLNIAKNDSTEYELIIIDPGFQNWFITNARPKWYHADFYYELKNRMYVATWNSQVQQTMGRPPFEYYINYDPNINYGLELNYKLYWYFKYIESTYGIDLGGG